MKTLGLIGGIGPESTIEYYRLIIAAYREQNPKRAYPSFIVNSINLQQYLDLINANDLEQFANGLIKDIEVLARAGADFGALASNTPHIVFDELQRRSSLPLDQYRGSNLCGCAAVWSEEGRPIRNSLHDAGPFLS